MQAPFIMFLEIRYYLRATMAPGSRPEEDYY
jgi:hypothetical protein